MTALNSLALSGGLFTHPERFVCDREDCVGFRKTCLICARITLYSTKCVFGGAESCGWFFAYAHPHTSVFPGVTPFPHNRQVVTIRGWANSDDFKMPASSLDSSAWQRLGLSSVTLEPWSSRSAGDEESAPQRERASVSHLPRPTAQARPRRLLWRQAGLLRPLGTTDSTLLMRGGAKRERLDWSADNPPSTKHFAFHEGGAAARAPSRRSPRTRTVIRRRISTNSK